MHDPDLSSNLDDIPETRFECDSRVEIVGGGGEHEGFGPTPKQARQAAEAAAFSAGEAAARAVLADEPCPAGCSEVDRGFVVDPAQSRPAVEVPRKAGCLAPFLSFLVGPKEYKAIATTNWRVWKECGPKG